MQYWAAIKAYFYKKALAKQLAARPSFAKKAVNFQSAQQIGVLFDATTQQNREAISTYTKQLSAKGKKVTLFGYIRDKYDKNRPSHPFEYCHAGEIDWKGIPEATRIQKFIDHPFDVLISVNFDANTVLDCLSALAKAHLKIAPYTDTSVTPYDITIDLNQRKDIAQFLYQAEHFMNKLTVNHYASVSM